MKHKSIIPICLFLIFLIPPYIQAATLEVGAGKPYTTIQSAINAASTGDTVLVFDGIYTENIYISKVITVRSLNGAASTIIDGNQIGSVVHFYHGYFGQMLDGFTITNGIGVSYDGSLGGGIFCDYSPAFIINCIIIGNSVPNAPGSGGGGIACYGSTPQIINCLIISNSAYAGGGIWCADSSPIITNCTFTGNYATKGGGIFCLPTSSPPTVNNSILWGDATSVGYNEIQLGGSPLPTISVAYSDIQGGWTGSGNINTDPLFVYGGGNFHLTASSPCIDSGTSASAPSYDIDGNLRPQGAGYDMGAYEYSVPTLITLSSFTAAPSKRNIVLEWTTESEIENAGFNLYRTAAENSEYVKINDSLIPAKGTSTSGASYKYIDDDVKLRQTYYYKLEDIDLNGKSTMHGPVSAIAKRAMKN